MHVSFEKPRTFFYHYNKPASLKAGTPKLSVHFNNTCYIVDNVECSVKTHSHHQKRQPRCIIKGLAKTLTITKTSQRGDLATIWNDNHSTGKILT